MGLRKYLSKRHFGKTPEPKGGKQTRHKKLAFVVQEHHASQLHYDFRLELDGVLKSWAVPKGPSMDPHVHHLAVHVEDHPYEYRNFEGVIPEGNYGAGKVIIWDEGWYEARKGKAEESETTLRAELKKGHLTFILHGKKLKGEFALVRMHGDDKTWLLIKKGDNFATTKDITEEDESVRSGLTVEEVGEQKDKLMSGHGKQAIIDPAGLKSAPLAAYPKVDEPWKVKPMLCTLVDEPFTRDGWLFEVKWDGYRAIGAKHGQDVRLYSRNDTDFREHYPPVVEALQKLKHDVILDGEIVVVDKDGRPHFELLQHWRHTGEGEIRYYVFDILWCDGHDVRDMPLIERKKLLERIVPKHSIIHYSDHVEKHGEELFNEMRRRGLEGVVAKQANSPYAENNRGSAWLKIKTHRRQEFVIGGFTEPRGGRKYLGALVVGVYEGDELVYVGHSGGGIPDRQRQELRKKLERIERKTSPFVVEPRPNAPVHWVRPELVCEMSFSEWTSDGSMRHPQFAGMRADKNPRAIHREKPRSAHVVSKQKAQAKGGRMPKPELEFTHLDKVFFPKHKITKGDMIKYYESMAEYILPYLQDRPCSMLRMPNGINGEGFFQKNNEHLPAWVPHADIFSESNNADLRWIVGGKLETLLYMVQLGCVEINPWNSRVGHLDHPDWIVIDLDPEGTITFKNVVTVAREVRSVCDEWGIASLPKTSGKTGIHIYIPLHAKYTYEQAKNFAHLLVLEVNKRQPKLTSVERMPAKRKNKIYLDFLQNREGQTLAAPYSLRPNADACVSMPLHWDEVTPSLKPTDFTIKNAHARVKRTGDIWKPVLGRGVDMVKILAKLEKQQSNAEKIKH